MFDAGKLYKQRLKTHFNILNRYLRYIFNGHFMIALMFLIVTMAVYYQQALTNLSDQFPSAFVIAVVLGLVVAINPFQSFLQAPDKVFITVKENAMKPYFTYAHLYNYAMQLYVVLLTFAASMPLYTKAYPAKTTIQIGLLLLLVLVIKAWNMAMQWQMMRVRNRLWRKIDTWARGIASIALVYTFIVETYFIIGILSYIIICVLAWRVWRKHLNLAWDVLIENDRYRLAGFYRFVSMFADVPQLQKPLRKRSWLAKILHKRLPFTKEQTYAYLYRLTFIRSSDYLMMYVRLLVIGSIFIIYIPNGMLKVAFALLFVYLSSFQLITLYYHYDTMIWLDLYPITEKKRQEAFLSFLYRLTMVQLVLYVIILVLIQQYQFALIVLGIGLVFAYLFVHHYAKKKINKK